MRLSAQPFTLWTEPGRVDKITKSNAPPPAERKAAHGPQRSGGTNWLAAAAAIAVAALLGLKYFSERSHSQRLEAENDDLRSKMEEAASTGKVKLDEANRAATMAANELEAKQADFTNTQAELKKTIATASEAAKKATQTATETAAALDRANKELSETKKAFAAKETTLQNNVTALTEEISKVKRVAGEEASKVKETMAKLEQEKATAVKEATAAMADRDTLKAEIEKLRKQVEAQSKGTGTPQA